MSHFAHVIDGKVVEVLVAEQDFIDVYSTQVDGQFVQTSYNTFGGVHYDPTTGEPSADQSKALRKNYAGIGMTYDADRDAFYDPQPFPSWTLNEDSCLWQAPVAYPDDGNYYVWDEAELKWTLMEPANND